MDAICQTWLCNFIYQCCCHEVEREHLQRSLYQHREQRRVKERFVLRMRQMMAEKEEQRRLEEEEEKKVLDASINDIYQSRLGLDHISKSSTPKTSPKTIDAQNSPTCSTNIKNIDNPKSPETPNEKKWVGCRPKIHKTSKNTKGKLTRNYEDKKLSSSRDITQDIFLTSFSFLNHPPIRISPVSSIQKKNSRSNLNKNDVFGSEQRFSLMTYADWLTNGLQKSIFTSHLEPLGLRRCRSEPILSYILARHRYKQKRKSRKKKRHHEKKINGSFEVQPSIVGNSSGFDGDNFILRKKQKEYSSDFDMKEPKYKKLDEDIPETMCEINSNKDIFTKNSKTLTKNANKNCDEFIDSEYMHNLSPKIEEKTISEHKGVSQMKNVSFKFSFEEEEDSKIDVPSENDSLSVPKQPPSTLKLSPILINTSRRQSINTYKKYWESPVEDLTDDNKRSGNLFYD